jgi:hypothetical protein
VPHLQRIDEKKMWGVVTARGLSAIFSMIVSGRMALPVMRCCRGKSFETVNLRQTRNRSTTAAVNSGVGLDPRPEASRTGCTTWTISTGISSGSQLSQHRNPGCRMKNGSGYST